MSNNLNGMEGNARQPGLGWAEPVRRLDVEEVPAGAKNLNLDGRPVTNPLKGFGPLWQRTYKVRLEGVTATPAEVMRTWKLKFPHFQPPHNHFYATRDGVVPGELLFIESTLMVAPGVRHITPIASGVMVMYVDETSFSVITPVGFPVSGWNTFSTYEEDGCTVAQVQVLDRSSDPVYEFGYRFMGGERKQDGTWKYVLRSLAAYYGVDGEVRVQKVAVDPRLQWRNAGNIWYNASLRTLFHRVSLPVRMRMAPTPAVAPPPGLPPSQNSTETLRRSPGGASAPGATSSAGRTPASASDAKVGIRQPLGPINGFGQLWQKSYRIRLAGVDMTPQAMVAEWRTHFAELLPPGNRLAVAPQHLAPGQVAVVNLGTPAGATMAAEAIVIYADAQSFSFAIPQGHKFAGMITCSAHRDEPDVIVAQVQVLVRPSDPIHELGCRFGGVHAEEDTFWQQTLCNLAAHFGGQGQPEERTLLVDSRIRWSAARNVRHNAALRSMIAAPFSVGRKFIRSIT